MPESLSKRIISARRYLSLHTPGGPEDVFPYYNPKASWSALKKIHVPLAVIIGQKDQHLGKWRAEDLIDVFTDKAIATPCFTGIAIRRADHGFNKTGKELAEALAEWIREN